MKRRARIGQNGKCRGRWYDKRCVGAGVLDGPHDRRIWFFGVIFSGSGAGAKTILLRNERGNLTRTCGMRSGSHTEHSAPEREISPYKKKGKCPSFYEYEVTKRSQSSFSTSPTMAMCSSSSCFCSTTEGAPIMISWAFLFMGRRPCAACGG